MFFHTATLQLDGSITTHMRSVGKFEIVKVVLATFRPYSLLFRPHFAALSSLIVQKIDDSLTMVVGTTDCVLGCTSE